ncbi:MAG: AAA family ATPase [Mycoplasmoidaceae bacterium]
MIFLKKIQAKGFKSYSDNVVISFEHPMIGIVGPNGAGKSNVIDAIKWVLGEKSHKALRGKKSDDVIFHGSEKQKASDYAEVTLTFLNNSGILYLEEKEISVTRRLEKGESNNIYLINGKEARLKDIQDIFLDTGLSKGSLGIISQGTVNWFAEAKAEERRKIFEEAAGIGRYTKKKLESIRQLERSEVNFNRLSDLIRELEKDLKKLNLQADKLQKYDDMKQELTKLELNILVKDIMSAKNEIDEISNSLSEAREKNALINPEIISLEQERNNLSNIIDTSESKIMIAREKIESFKKELNNNEIKKSIIENNVSKNRESGDDKIRASALSATITNLKSDIESKKTLIEENKKSLNLLKNEYIAIESKKNYLNEKYFNNNSELSRMRTIHANLVDNSKNKNFLAKGVKGILDNKNALNGIHGILSDLIDVEEDYEKAILTALGNSTSNIIVNTHNNAANAIKFLKENRIGQATFLPIYSITPKYVPENIISVLEEIEGYCGICSEKVIPKNKIYQPVIDYLLARTLISRNIEEAEEIYEYSKKNYKIITLDGDVIMPGGAARGGYNRIFNSSLNEEKKINDLEYQINEIETIINKDKVQLSNFILKITEISAILNEKNMTIARIEEQIQNSTKELIKYEAEYTNISSKPIEENQIIEESVSNYDTLIFLIKDLTSKIDELNEIINSNEEIKKQAKLNMIEMENKIHDLRSQLHANTEYLLKFSKREVYCQSVLENAKEKINSTYKLALEFAIENYSGELPIPESEARERVIFLNKQIDYLGNINMDALNELKEKQERYDYTSKELESARAAKDNILNIINEADSKATIDYENTINKINEVLPGIFQYLFGGGNCKVMFSNNENILESGIEIMAEPPGKKVNSLVALSGGEKTLVALSVLFAILKISHFPLVILDEAEAALDPANVERFGKIISEFSKETQFIVITHRPGTMERCDSLYGATMIVKGVTKMYKVHLSQAKKEFAEELSEE